MMYRNKTQQEVVTDVVRMLLNYSAENDCCSFISKETLTLICDRYCYVVDPPKTPGVDDRYSNLEDDND